MYYLTPQTATQLKQTGQFVRASAMRNPCHKPDSTAADEAPWVVMFIHGSNPLCSTWGYCRNRIEADNAVKTFHTA